MRFCRAFRSCNYTFASFFRVEEACEYTPHPDNPQHTLYKQTATYKVSGLGLPVNRAVENVSDATVVLASWWLVLTGNVSNGGLVLFLGNSLKLSAYEDRSICC